MFLCIAAFPSPLLKDSLMAIPGITPDSGMRRRPTTRKISMRSAVHHIAGQEPPYPVYQFSQRIFIERPKHKPFA
jgi:hypothetical protein